MKKTLLSVVMLAGFAGLFAQSFKDATPASFVQGIDNNCSSACGDLNSDGSPDIILTGRENSSGLHKTWIYLNDGKGGFTLSANSNIEKGLQHSYVSLKDYDGDGDLDIIMQGWEWNPETQVNTQRAYIYENDGNAVFTKIALLDGRSNGCIVFGDYDNDGKMDVLQTGWKDDGVTPGHGKTTLYHNDGNNRFSIVNGVSLFDLADGQARFGDYDNDGNLDIIVCGWMQTHIYKGDGKGKFVNQNISLPAYDFSYVDWIDYDKDGFLDILIGGHQFNDADFYATKIFKGNGTNVFTEKNFGLTNVQRGPVKTGDCNGDGKTDFFISGWGGAPEKGGPGGVFRIFKNDGTDNAFSEVAGINDLIGGWADGTMVVADFDGDGYDDIFKCGWEKTRLYLNTTNDNPTQIEAQDHDVYSVRIVNNVLNIHVSEESGLNYADMYTISGKLVTGFAFAGNNASFGLPALEKGVYVVCVRNEKSYTPVKVTIK